MSIEKINASGMGLLGCGKMGSALLQGWLQQGVKPENVYVIDPAPSDWLLGTGVKVNKGMPAAPAVVLIAVKPQMMGEALPVLTPLGNGSTLFVSIAAGTKIAAFENVLGSMTPIIRVMPNTPAAINQGISALIGNRQATPEHLGIADALMSAVGQVVRLDSEDQMDAVTGVSGSGPAYVFHLIETLAAAGEAQGLDAAIAMQLAKATVAGAGALAEVADESPGQLRVNVTSPAGTTAAALEVLMDAESGFPKLLNDAVAAATERSKELSR